MSTITVRQAVIPDLEALAILFDSYRQFYGRPGDLRAARKFLLSRFDHCESILFIAHEDGMPVGFAQLYPSFSSVYLTRTFIFNDIYVPPEHRLKGVGRLLISAATQYAVSLGAYRMTLSTGINNTTAQTLYESCGWRRDDQFYVYNMALKP